jgi:hypothetical protein
MARVGAPAPAVHRETWPLLVSVLVSAALLPAVLYGLLSDSAYRGYDQDLVLVSRAQDVLTVLVVPLLLWAGSRSRRSVAAHVLWLGLLFYLAYSYAIYLVGWPENRAFLLYVVVVLLSSAALVDGLVRVSPSSVQPAVAGFRTRGLGRFLVVIGVAFIGLWLTDVGPSALGGRAPSHLGPGGTPYAVYVLLLRRHPMAAVVGGVVLVKVTTLFTALWLGVGAQLLAGRHVAFTADMVPSALLPLVTVAVLVHGARRLGRPEHGWLRDRLWV